MNPSVVLKNLFKSSALAVAAGGALLLASCYTPAPPPGPPFGPPPPTNFGYNGTRSPTYPGPATTKPGEPIPRIERDPTDTHVDVTPPPRNPGTTSPSSPSGPEVTGPVVPPTPPKPPPAAVRDDLPFGIPVVGKSGRVYSPYAPEKGEVDVTTPQGTPYKRGTRVECPYTGKHFRVP